MMIYGRKYLQYNNLVIDEYDVIADTSTKVDFKLSEQERPFGHGSYVVHKSDFAFAEPFEVTLTVRLSMRKLPCEYRPYYPRYAITELTRYGKLWAIQNGELIWAYADIVGITEQRSRRTNYLEYVVDFRCYEGVWHKANKQKTFLLPYNPCMFMECMGYRTLQPCLEEGDCCESCKNREAEHIWRDNMCCCCSDSVLKDMALCYHLNELERFYDECVLPWQIVYDCSKGAEFFGEIGQKICAKDACSNIVAGRIYVEGDIPTESMRIKITGGVNGASITINGNTNIISGEYDGLYLTESGDVYAISDCCETLIDPAAWVVPAGQGYGWRLYPGENSVVVNTNDCCGMSCVYIDADNLTI